MQAGFMCLECGFTRAKNSINVAIKNFTDFVVAYALFWSLGYGLMFGASWGGLIGTNQFFLALDTSGAWIASFFFFQAMFCATAATILSGAIAERLHFSGYVMLTVLTSLVVYPLFGHWCWGGAAGASEGGWLQKMGFVDFAGSSVVHSIGGWVALAVILIIGPRTGRFPEGAPPQKVTGYNMPMSVLGCILLFLGWFGFNGGSTLALNDSVARIIANTALAGAFGSCASLFVGWWHRGRPDVELVVNGALAGLVAITANCNAVTAPEAALIGAVGGLISLALQELMDRLRLDDAVCAVPVHLGAGIWGTMAVALFGAPEILATGLGFQEQLGVQALGVLCCGLVGFVLVFVVVSIINRVHPLRVSLEEEEMGLNVAEHGTSTEIIDLLRVMEKQAQTADLGLRVPVEPFTEVGQIARRYNQVMDMLEKAVARAENIVRGIQEGIITWARDGVITSLNPGAEKLFAVRYKEMRGRPVNLLFATPQGALFDMNALLQEGERDMGIIGCPRGGAPFPVDLRVSRGEVNGEEVFTGLVKDITDRRAAEDALKDSRDRIAHHNEALAEMALRQQRMSYDFADAVGRLLEVVTRTLDVRQVSIWRHEERYRKMACLYRYTANSVSLEEAQGVFEMSEAPELVDFLTSYRTQAISNPAKHRYIAPLFREHFEARGVQAMLLAQVRLGGDAGVMFLEHVGEKRTWLPEEEQFAGSAADFVTLAYENVQRRDAEEAVRAANQRLEERVRERTGELEVSYRELQGAMDDLRHAQTQLVQSEKMAALGELVAGIAHEINTPVGVAVTAASHFEQKTRWIVDQLAKGAIKKSDLEAYLSVSEESARMLMTNLQRAAELVQSFKQVAVDQASAQRRAFNLRSYVDEVIVSLRPKLKKTELIVLNECPASIDVNSYPGAYSQIIANLIINSIMHAYEPNQRGIIRLHFEVVEEELVFTYSDDGKGIEPTVLGRIFDPFFTTKRGRGGSGLGLHILYNIVTGTLNGSIECQSEVGNGTRFIFRIPFSSLETRSEH